MLKTDILPQVATTGRYDAHLNSLRGLEGKAGEQARLEKAAKEFEALMVEMMVREMRKNVPQSPLLGESKGHQVFREMLDGEYVRLMAQRTDFGLSKMLVQQLSKQL